MPRSTADTRKRILDAGYGLFRRKGYTRVTMDDIAGAAKLTKRSLYYHFRSKDQLLGAVLEDQHVLAVAAFRTFGDALAGSATDVVDRMFKDLAVWADTPRWAGSGFTRLVVELADLRGHPARVIARRHKAMLEAMLSDVLARSNVPDASARAREVWLLSEGAITLTLVHGDKGYVRAAADAAKRLLVAPTARAGTNGRPKRSS